MNYYKYLLYWVYKNQKKKWDSHIVGISNSSMLATIIIWLLIIDIQSILMRINFIESRFKPYPYALIIICAIFLFNILLFTLKRNYISIEAKYDDLSPKKHKKAKFACAGIAVLIFLGLFII